LRLHTAIGRLLDRTVIARDGPNAWDEIDMRWAQANPGQARVYENGRVQTVITPPYRMMLEDLNDPRIAEGLRITQERLPVIKAAINKHGVHLLLLLIPSKEFVFCSAMNQQNATGTDCAQLSQNESRLRDAIVRDCLSNQIEYVDPEPPLVAAVLRQEQIYPPNSESHPQAHGYSIIATTIRAKLQELNW
jgi:hypothetical protein